MQTPSRLSAGLFGMRVLVLVAIAHMQAGCADTRSDPPDGEVPLADADGAGNDGDAADDDNPADGGDPEDAGDAGADIESCPGWSSQDIGQVGIVGDFACSDGVFTLSASGADIWNTADAFRFAYQQVDGDVTIQARVVSNTAGEPWSKAGVMVRESLSPDSSHTHMLISASAANPVKFDLRPQTGASTSGLSGSLLNAPYWVKISRAGDTFLGFESPDGISWSLVGMHRVDMASRAYVGLSLTSHDDASLATAVFDNVTIEPVASPECATDGDCDDGDASTVDACSGDGVCTHESQGPYTGHEALLNDVVGYGRHVTGGAGGPLIEVTNTDDGGPGSLREALAVDGPKWIYFTPGLTGTIDAQTLMYMNSDTTIDGRGADISIGGFTLNVYEGDNRPANNIVIHNVKFTGGLPDQRNVIRIRYGGSRYWLDHITFISQPGDGKYIGVSNAATDITVSWCDFTPPKGLVFIISSDNESPEDANIRLTGHHNHFHETGERHPRVRYATIHWLNNYIKDWGGYGSSISQEGFFFAENNIYEAGRKTGSAIITRIGSWPDSGDPLEGNLKTVGNWWKNGTVVPNERNPETVPMPEYPYDADPADQALIDAIVGGAGFKQVPSPFE